MGASFQEIDCKRQCSTSWLVLVDDAQGSKGLCQKAEYTGECGKDSLAELRFLVDFTVSSQWFSPLFLQFSARASHWVNLRLSIEMAHVPHPPIAQ